MAAQRTLLVGGDMSMANGLLVGIDYGELGMRVAYASKDATAVLSLDVEAREPAILFDPSRNVSSLGVGFPSLLHSVGLGTEISHGGGNATAEALIQRRLTAIIDQLKEKTSDAPGATVIAVPASLSQRKRQTLVECARQAGFTDVSLVDRSIAVSLGVRSDRDQSATFVVFCLDYGACEYSLARLGRGRCWMVGSGFDPNVSGERLDALIMEDIILALRERQLFLGLRGFSAEQWQMFRALAESIRHALATNKIAQVTISPELVSGANVTLQIDPARFGLLVKRHLAEALDNINALLEQNQLERSNIDAVLVAGEVATTYPVANILWEAFPSRVARTDVNVVALGALVCAVEGAGASPINLSDSDFRISADIRGLAAGASLPAENDGSPNRGRFSDVIHFVAAPQKAAPRPASESRPPASSEWIKGVRAMIAQGRYDEAEQAVEELATQLDQLRMELKASVPSMSQQLIQQAQAQVVAGNYADAVRLSHQAYQGASHDPAVFSRMMKIHTDAGLGLGTAEQYEDAIRILTCAYNHDQTDRSVHKALAERHYMHAAAMLKLNNFDRALEAAKTALTFDPKHVQANELAAELLRPEVPGPDAAR
jgi:tetratricopeptide (TPR) repeat protein